MTPRGRRPGPQIDPATEARITELWLAGASGAEIARRVGVTRQAVHELLGRRGLVAIEIRLPADKRKAVEDYAHRYDEDEADVLIERAIGQCGECGEAAVFNCGCPTLCERCTERHENTEPHTRR